MDTKVIMSETIDKLNNKLIILKNVRKFTNKQIKQLNNLLNDKYTDKTKVNKEISMYIQELRLINNELKLCKSAIKRFNTLLDNK